MKKVANNQLEDILKIVCFDIYVSNSGKKHVKEFIFQCSYKVWACNYTKKDSDKSNG